MMTSRFGEPVDMPVLRVDPAIWEHDGGADREARLTARLQLGDLNLRLEARAVDSRAAEIGAHAQMLQIGTRSYVVVGYEDDRSRELVAV